MPSSPARPDPVIGDANRPVRALSFSTGLFDTAMHLGVAHALLVIRGRAPDVVVGVSAGAVNAAAVAEILQAGTTVPTTTDLERRADGHRRRREARVARFREIFAAFQQAPTELLRALLPDTYQVQARRPLAPVSLPIHHAQERDHRAEAVNTRAGLINLLNTLLRLRITFGTLTRGVRRGLGWRAAAEVRSPVARALARVIEVVRTFNLIGSHLHQVAPLIYPFLLRPLLFSPRKNEHGGTAESLIFVPPWWGHVRHGVQTLLGGLGLWWLWLGAASVLPLLLLWSMTRLASVTAGHRGARVFLALSLVSLGLLLSQTRAWQELCEFAHLSSGRLARAVLLSFGQLCLLALVWVTPLFAVLLFTRRPLAWSGPSPVVDLTDTLRITTTVLATSAVMALLLGAWLLWTRRSSHLPGGSRTTGYAQKLLASFKLERSIFDPHPLREILVGIFDPDYYGVRDMDGVVAHALRDQGAPTPSARRPRPVGHYATREPPIRVGLAVADVATGEIRCVADSEALVDGLLAATSLVPVFPPTTLADGLYVDGGNVATEPTHPLMNLVRNRLHPEATELHVYSVTPLPVSRGQLATSGEPPIYLSLIDVTRRALQLQRLRDAMLERRLTHLYSRVIPPGAGREPGRTRNYVRAWIAPIEPDQPIDVNQRYFAQENEEDRQRLIRETVADGCRASMEVMIRDSMPPSSSGVIPCSRAVETHFERMVPHLSINRPDLREPLTGVVARLREALGPGLPEVCRHCALHRGQPDEAGQTLQVRQWDSVLPAWPVEGEPEMPPAPLTAPPFKSTNAYRRRTSAALTAYKAEVDDATGVGAPRWPLDREESPGRAREPGHDRALVSMLFSGGVFRGVYQMGVLTAVSEIGLTPDIVAGASVGSITAAMAAESLSHPTLNERRPRIARLAATYLALDRLVMTDRFADFIRTLTIRAAETGFSVREADRFFRRYDTASAAVYSDEARRVIAGLERLLYISPYELNDLVRALRHGQTRKVTQLVGSFAEEWLDRMQVGNQVLGAEPLTLLITEHVLRAVSESLGVEPEAVPFDAFLKRGIYFLATATNLSQGRLEVLGEQQLGDTVSHANLLNGLLASSAFPGVFRPRWSWEVMPGTRNRHQYIDGGVFDNLPLDAVAQFLQGSADADLITRRPMRDQQSVPHLIFAASLEVEPQRNIGPERLRQFAEFWPDMRRRATRLGYNRKLELYRDTQRNVRTLWNEFGRTDRWTPLDLEVVTVRPNWLCGTFAFHPMLGFRRSQQAASIAHGCATTLLELARLEQTPQGGTWLDAWGIAAGRLPRHPPADRNEPIIPPAPAAPGDCYWRPGKPCPYSGAELAKLALPAATVAALGEIYRACGEARTHESSR